MPAESDVYDKQADNYDLLVSREDYQGNILPAIQKACSFDNKIIVELGAGTGRLTRLVAPLAERILAFDLSHHMLTRARSAWFEGVPDQVSLGVADSAAVPLPSNCADIILAGWSFCYLAVWGEAQWKERLDAGMAEIRRVLKPTGVAVILETAGTGFETPNPPPHLDEYFAYLREQGFLYSWIRTDYQFEDIDEAVRLSEFFFGKELGSQVLEKKWVILPECTGIWVLNTK